MKITLTNFLLVVIVRISFGFKFRDYSYTELQNRALSLNGDFCFSKRANETLPVTSSVQGKVACSPAVIRVSDQSTVRQDVYRPQVLISGEIHGDERVGPSASVLLAELLVHSAACKVTESAKSCEYLSQFRLTPYQIDWLSFLATRRDAFIIPTANCLGYLTGRRDDAGVDPNRDFAYMRQDNKCFRSSTAKIFNALFAENLIQIVVTFHGGMAAIGYEWGSKNHPRPNDRSPDQAMNAVLAESMRRFAGGFSGEKLYPVGPINSLVYSVDGGMEDWMYAAGWDKANLKISCSGYDQSSFRDPGGGDQARAAVFLVETSDDKKPRDNTLGGSEEILSPSSASNGHVPRNVRLSLLALDMAAPYNCLSFLAHSISRVTLKQMKDYTSLFTGSGGSGIMKQGSWNSSLSSESSSSSNAATSVISGDSLRNVRQPTEHDKAEPSMRVASELPASPAAHEDPSNDADENSAVEITTIAVKWYVGGAAAVDMTWLALHKPSKIDEEISKKDRNWSYWLDSLEPPPLDDHFLGPKKLTSEGLNEERAGVAPPPRFRHRHSRRNHSYRRRALDGGSERFPLSISKPQKGIGRWRTHDQSSALGPEQPEVYEDHLRLAKSPHNIEWNRFNESIIFLEPGLYWMVAWSVVDSSWGNSNMGNPVGGPQSFLSRGRTMETSSNTPGDLYFETKNGRVFKPRKFWPSDVTEIKVHDDGRIYTHSTVMDCAWWRRHYPERHVEDTPLSNVTSPTEPNNPEPIVVKAIQEDISHGGQRSSSYYVFVLVGLVGSATVVFSLAKVWHKHWQRFRRRAIIEIGPGRRIGSDARHTGFFRV